MTFEKFRREVLGLNRPRKHKVKNSLGVYDAFKYYRKTKPKDKQYVLTESQYFSIIRTVNKLLGEELLKCEDVTFPLRMGGLELRKRPTLIEVVDNKLKTNMPVDWNSTLKLWSQDEESYKKKQLVRLEEKEVFSIHYSRKGSNYNNQSFYQFNVNRDLKQRLKVLIKENKIDAYNLWQNNTRV